MTGYPIYYRIPYNERIQMKTFYITYYGNKHKKHITRQGKHDDKSRFGVAKNGVAYYVYYDLDSHGYRTASGNWKVRY